MAFTVLHLPSHPSHWVAPEVLLGNRQVSQACDIWSMGVVLWEVRGPQYFCVHRG